MRVPNLLLFTFFLCGCATSAPLATSSPSSEPSVTPIAPTVAQAIFAPTPGPAGITPFPTITPLPYLTPLPTVVSTIIPSPSPSLSPERNQLPDLTLYKTLAFRYNVSAFAFSPDGNHVAVGRVMENQGFVIQLLEIATGKPVWTYSIPPAGIEGTSAIAFSPDGSLIAAGGAEAIIFLLDARSGKFLKEQDHYGAIFALGFSRDGQRVLAAGCGTGPQEEGLTVWNYTHNSATRYPLCVVTMVTAPISPYVATDTFSFINFETGKTNSELPETDGNIAFSPDGKVMATGTDNLMFWDLTPKTSLNGIPWQRYQSNITGLAWSTRNMLAILSDDGTIVVWNMNNSEPIGSAVLLGAERLAFSSDGTQLAALGNKLSGPAAPLTIWHIP
jgi:hypothetical protein